MPRRKIFLPLEVTFADDPECAARLARYTRPGEARAVRDLLVQMWCYCKAETTDGHVPFEQVGKLAYPDTARVAERDAERLVECGIAERTESGYFFPYFLKHNKSRAQIADESARKAAIGAKGGKASGAVRAAEAKTKQSAKHVGSATTNTEDREQRTENNSEPAFGGERTETLRVVPDTTPPNKPTCIKHPDGNPKNEPCGGCAKIRERSESSEARDSEKRRKAAEDAARNCPRCEGTNKILTETKTPTTRRCWPHLPAVAVTA